MTDVTDRLADLHPNGLAIELAALRDEIESLVIRFEIEHGDKSETMQRAEQAAAAIQRLEWAIRRKALTRAAGR